MNKYILLHLISFSVLKKKEKAGLATLTQYKELKNEMKLEKKICNTNDRPRPRVEPGTLRS